MKTKSVYETYKQFFVYGRKFETTNPRIFFIVCLYAVDEMTVLFKQNKNIFSEKERQEFIKELSDLNKLKEKKEKEIEKEEYVEFLENIFANVDDEDRTGEVTESTAYKFKMLSVLIEVLKKWGEEAFNNEWKEKSKFSICLILYLLVKYCKFKAVDIAKALKNGEKPRRGGPNDVKIPKEEKKIIAEDHTVPDTFDNNFINSNNSNVDQFNKSNSNNNLNVPYQSNSNTIINNVTLTNPSPINDVNKKFNDMTFNQGNVSNSFNNSNVNTGNFNYSNQNQGNSINNNNNINNFNTNVNSQVNKDIKPNNNSNSNIPQNKTEITGNKESK